MRQDITNQCLGPHRIEFDQENSISFGATRTAQSRALQHGWHVGNNVAALSCLQSGLWRSYCSAVLNRWAGLGSANMAGPGLCVMSDDLFSLAMGNSSCLPNQNTWQTKSWRLFYRAQHQLLCSRYGTSIDSRRWDVDYSDYQL